MTKVEALREVITELGGTPAGTTTAELIAEIADLVSGAESSYQLPTASASTLGGVKVDGTTIVIDENGVISVPTPADNAEQAVS